MLTNSFSDFIGYFRKLAEEHREIKHFAHGPAARILNNTRSGFAYPCLWLETPSLHLAEKDGTDPNGVRQCAFVVLTQCNGGYEEQDAAWALTEQIALEIIARMRHDRKLRLFTFDGSVHLDAISTLTVDSDFGWRVEFETSKTTGLCYVQAVWDRLPTSTATQ
jgi:hypothetical protein